MEKLNSGKSPATTLPLMPEKEILLSHEGDNKNLRLSLRPQKSLMKMKSMRPRILIPIATEKK
jgi:hypothetical protein